MNYKQVYFRINAPMYYKNKYGVGFESQEDRELFFNTVKEMFLSDGWEIKKKKYESDSSCPTIIKNKQELYLHPQSFSGVIKEENISYIENFLSNNDVFKFERTDIYDDLFDITDDEYINILKSKKEHIEQDILEACKTKRSNLYIADSWAIISKITDKYKIKRLFHHIGIVTSDDIDIKYVTELFEKLVENNKILTAQTKSGLGYRTDKKYLKSA